MKISICDFEDSFTYNIYSELLELGFNAQVISFNQIKEFLQNKINSKEKHVIILGPGPGHPSEYLFLQESILNLLKNPNVFVMGICLGHQLIWYFQGCEVSHAKNPSHGNVETYQLNSIWKNMFDKSITVQRYNSLSVKFTPYEIQKQKDKAVSLFIHDQECIMSLGQNFISYQFHPESIGTSCPEQFLRPIKEFLI